MLAFSLDYVGAAPWQPSRDQPHVAFDPWASTKRLVAGQPMVAELLVLATGDLVKGVRDRSADMPFDT